MPQPLRDSADLTASSSGSGRSRSRSWRLHRRHIVWDATVWVLFLALPIIQLFLGSFAWWQRLLGLTGVLGFIAGYVWAFSTPDNRASSVGVPPIGLPTRVLLRELAVQTFFTVLTLPALGWWTVCFFPFFCSLILFSTTLRRGIPTVVMATGLLVAASLLWNTHPDSHWQVLGISLTEVPIVIARIAVELQERRTAAERELALVSQREALGRDVHDILGHSLTVLTLKAEVARRLIEHDVRSTVTRLRSPDLASQVEATRTALSAAQIDMEMLGSAQDIPERQRALMAWALREATTNIVRHARATNVTVHLAPGMLRVSDDGVGLAGDQPGNGLEGLRSRFEQEGGSLTIVSPLTRRTDLSGDVETDSADEPSGGTRLEVRLP